MNKEDSLLINIAYMYYEERATQQEISERFNISRSSVSKYLKRARENGIVEIHVNTEGRKLFTHLEKQLVHKFGLQDVLIVDGKDEELIIQKLGQEGARYLLNHVQSGDVLGLSAGRTLNAIAQNFKSKMNFENVTIVPLVGGLGTHHTSVQANSIINLLGDKTGSQTLNLYAPILMDTVEAKEIIISQSFYKPIFDMISQVNIAVVGIGGKPKDDFSKKAYLHEIKINEEIINQNISGDICYRFINKNGEALNCSWNNRVVAPEMSVIKSIPLVIGVSGGKVKYDGILACLNGRLIDVLITDSKTASRLLKE